MALLRKQADLLEEGFYVLEEPTAVSKRYLVGRLEGVDPDKSNKYGHFMGYKKTQKQLIGLPLFTLDEAELAEFLDGDTVVSDLALPANLSQSEKKSYLEVFEGVQQEMVSGELLKAVLYTKVKGEADSFPSLESFIGLLKRGLKNKNNAYLLGFYNPKELSALLGCSPEFLYKTDLEKNVITTAVAGTQNHIENENLNWSDKLLKEHELVMGGISDRLDGLVKWGEVDVLKHGSLNHLRAEGVISKEIGLSALSSKLHPTPAIGTLPVEGYENLILGPVERGFFGGYAELLSCERPFSLVSIRCFEWSNSSLQVCIGGGVLPESLAEKEWLELEDKWSSFKLMWEL